MAFSFKKLVKDLFTGTSLKKAAESKGSGLLATKVPIATAPSSFGGAGQKIVSTIGKGAKNVAGALTKTFLGTYTRAAVTTGGVGILSVSPTLRKGFINSINPVNIYKRGKNVGRAFEEVKSGVSGFNEKIPDFLKGGIMGIAIGGLAGFLTPKIKGMITGNKNDDGQPFIPNEYQPNLGGSPTAESSSQSAIGAGSTSSSSGGSVAGLPDSTGAYIPLGSIQEEITPSKQNKPRRRAKKVQPMNISQNVSVRVNAGNRKVYKEAVAVIA